MQCRAQVALRLGVLRHQLGGTAQRRQRILALAHEGHTEDLPQHAGRRMQGEQRPGFLFGLGRSILVDESNQRADLVGIERSHGAGASRSR